MIRERSHFTVKNLAAWNETLDLIQEIDEIQIAAGRTPATVWTQVVGKYNEIIIEADYPDLAAYEREVKAFMSDPAVLNSSRASRRSPWPTRAATSSS